MSPALRQRLREAVPSAILAVTIYLPLLLTKPGRVGADTKTYLYLDPARMLGRAPTMWDQNIGMGTVTHQNIGYLWPIGPWYWLADVVGMPDWIAQRLWLGTIMFAAGLGVRFMLKALGQEGPHVTAATFCYALTPYVLSLAARLSVILLPYAGLPWLIGLTVLALRRQNWRYPAAFALVVATIGSVNATALILVGVAPLLWIFHEVVITRDVRFRDAAKTVGRIGVLTVGCSLWWLAGLWAQGGYGIEILRYTETAETVATASLSLEVLRGLGYWFFYGEDRYGPWIAPSRSYTQRVDLLVLTYAIPALGLLGAAIGRFRERAFFVLLLATGLFLAVGAHPWDDPSPGGGLVKAFLQSDVGLSMRSLPRAAPLVMLSLSVFVGVLIASLTRNHQRLARPFTAGVMVLAVLALPPLWRGQMVDVNLDRPEEIPAYWTDAAEALDARADGTRVLEVPGADFASYRWGTTVDPVTPGLMDRPYVARELIPYGSPASADLLNAVDRRLQEGVTDPQGLAPMARFMAVGDVVYRADLTYERYNSPRPRLLWDVLLSAPGLDEALGFGGNERSTPRPDLPLQDEQELLTPPELPDPPQVAILSVADAEKIVRTASTDRPIIVAGSGEGLVDMASIGLVDGHELVTYAGSYAGDPDELLGQAEQGAVLVLTDTNRREARRWGTVRDTTGITERAGQDPMVEDPKDQRLELFPDATDDSFTVNESRGGVWAEATSYGNAVSLTPEDNPVNAVDGNVGTAWRTGGFSPADGETIRLTYRDPMTTDHLSLVQAIGGVRNRFITEIEVSFDGGEPRSYQLDESSREPGPDGRGQTIRFDERTFDELEITIVETDPGTLQRYDGISAVGFAEIRAEDVSGAVPVADDVVRLPVDLLEETGTDSLANALAVVLTRQRVSGSVAVRSDPERSMARTFGLPTPRGFGLEAQVRLSNAATDDILEQALGRPGADDGGVTATSKRRMPGGLANSSMMAIDGDPGTWYSPGFLGQNGEYLDYELAAPISFDRFDLTVLNDGRHSVPRLLRLEVDGEPVQQIRLPEVADQPTENGTHTFEVPLEQSVTGTRFTLVVEDDPEAMREVTTLDWFTGDPLVMPMGIAEFAVDGLSAPDLPVEVDASCRTDLVEVDGQPIGVELHGTTTELLAGDPIAMTTCDGASLDLPAGTTTLRTTPGGESGFDIDRLVLRSAPGGAADPATSVLVDPASQDDRPDLQITGEDRVSVDATVAEAEDDFWFVLGQSYNQGWHATADGVDLGEPTLVNGYANAWLVPAGSDIEIHAEWTPQRVVFAMIYASLAFLVLTLALLLWPRGRRAGAAGDDAPPLDQRPSMPQAFSMDRLLRYAGPTPSTFAWIGGTALAGVVGFAATGPVGALVLAVAAAVTLRIAKARPILTFGGPLLFVSTVAWLILRQLTQSIPPGFDWATYFEGAQDPAWIAVLALVLDAMVDRCWLRRWWPTGDSPS